MELAILVRVRGFDFRSRSTPVPLVVDFRHPPAMAPAARSTRLGRMGQARCDALSTSGFWSSEVFFWGGLFGVFFWGIVVEASRLKNLGSFRPGFGQLLWSAVLFFSVCYTKTRVRQVVTSLGIYARPVKAVKPQGVKPETLPEVLLWPVFVGSLAFSLAGCLPFAASGFLVQKREDGELQIAVRARGAFTGTLPWNTNLDSRPLAAANPGSPFIASRESCKSQLKS